MALLSSRGGISTSVLLRSADAALLVDAGDGAGRDLSDAGIDPASIAAVLLTHDHWDHVAGLPGLLWWMRLRGRREPLEVLRPAGAATAIALCGLFRSTFGERAKFAVVEREIAAGVPVELGGFRAAAFAVRHSPSTSAPAGALMEAYGFTLEADGVKVVVSGDTGPCEALGREVAGADLALLEASAPGSQDVPPDTHMNEAQARAYGRLAREWMPYHRP
ncbi:MAG: ribonuclease Z [Acidobacteria bacterium]|nr:ribonuclease Z [Acidobacteriota bacterium]